MLKKIITTLLLALILSSCGAFYPEALTKVDSVLSYSKFDKSYSLNMSDNVVKIDKNEKGQDIGGYLELALSEKLKDDSSLSVLNLKWVSLKYFLDISKGKQIWMKLDDNEIIKLFALDNGITSKDVHVSSTPGYLHTSPSGVVGYSSGSAYSTQEFTEKVSFSIKEEDIEKIANANKVTFEIDSEKKISGSFHKKNFQNFQNFILQSKKLKNNKELVFKEYKEEVERKLKKKKDDRVKNAMRR
ncbi:hypothetical protein AB751O23_AL_00140 [Chlamydiales bacterium SCGC AB-751-O23]|jgi:hypothetical protein|nr:hypothetical protein AB751O23_AL_00140 [Chlamydiales bacterium SCGC AB-751-O23]